MCVEWQANLSHEILKKKYIFKSFSNMRGEILMEIFGYVTKMEKKNIEIDMQLTV